MLVDSKPMGRLRHAQSAAVRGPDGCSVVVADEQRLRAHQKLTGPLAGQRSVLKVRSPSPIEEAQAYRRALDERNITQASLARELGVDARQISAKLSLLWLPASVHALLTSHPQTFGESHARLLAPFYFRRWVDALAHECAEGAWTLRQLRRAIDRASGIEQVSDSRPALFRRKGFTLYVKPQSARVLLHTLSELQHLVNELRSEASSQGSIFGMAVRETATSVTEMPTDKQTCADERERRNL